MCDEGRERQPDKHAVISVKSGSQRRLVGLEPDRGQRRSDDAKNAGEQHMRNTRHDRAPRDRRQKEDAGQGIVLEHDLPETAQANVDKSQRPGPRASRLPLCEQRFHADLPSPER